MAKRKNPWGWYAVKTAYRVTPCSEPKGTDDLYDPDFTLLEERVVLFRARSVEEAFEKSEAEANEYASERWRNPYGQQVEIAVLDGADCYEYLDAPGSGVEVYSHTEPAPRSLSEEACLNRLLGRQESERSRLKRRNICNIIFERPAPGVRLHKKERQEREMWERRVRELDDHD